MLGDSDESRNGTGMERNEVGQALTNMQPQVYTLLHFIPATATHI